MTVTITLEEYQVERLLKVLQQNVNAVEAENSVRWTNSAAARIDQVKQEIEDQTS